MVLTDALASIFDSKERFRVQHDLSVVFVDVCSLQCKSQGSDTIAVVLIPQQTVFKAAGFIELDLECLCDYFGGSWSAFILETAITNAMTFNHNVIILVFMLKIGMV